MTSGDRLLTLGGHELEAFADLSAELELATPGQALPTTVCRAGRVVSLQVIPTILFAQQNFSSNPRLNKSCDDNCNCTVDEPGFFCFEFQSNLGEEGPNGGLLFLFRCVSTQGPGQPEFVRDRIGEVF